MSPVKDKSAFLSCHHVRSIPIAKAKELISGSEVWCFKCQANAVILHYVIEFGYKCMDCRSARTFGAARLNMEIAASRHHRRMPHHEVVGFKGDEVLHRWKKQPKSDALPLGDDAPYRTEIPSEIPPF